jgi:excisionase family DNA binding protein
MSAPASSGVYPRGGDADVARDALSMLMAAVAVRGTSQEPVTLTVEGSNSFKVPRAAVDILVQALCKLASGQGVAVMPVHADLTTQEAADILSVSRPYLIRLLESGAIDYRLVGTRRKVNADSLYDYMRNLP